MGLFMSATDAAFPTEVGVGRLTAQLRSLPAGYAVVQLLPNLVHIELQKKLGVGPKFIRDGDDIIGRQDRTKLKRKEHFGRWRHFDVDRVHILEKSVAAEVFRFIAPQHLTHVKTALRLGQRRTKPTRDREQFFLVQRLAYVALQVVAVVKFKEHFCQHVRRQMDRLQLWPIFEPALKVLLPKHSLQPYGLASKFAELVRVTGIRQLPTTPTPTRNFHLLIVGLDGISVLRLINSDKITVVYRRSGELKNFAVYVFLRK